MALTFDDGNFSQPLEDLIRYSQEKGEIFTVFPTGRSLRTFPELWRMIKGQGHEIGNHSHSHIDAARSSASELVQDFLRFELADYPDTFSEPFAKPGLARVPYAEGVDEKAQKALFSLDDLNVHWILDSYSWKTGASAESQIG